VWALRKPDHDLQQERISSDGSTETFIQQAIRLLARQHLAEFFLSRIVSLKAAAQGADLP
jgi:hypothetical protein